MNSVITQRVLLGTAGYLNPAVYQAPQCCFVSRLILIRHYCWAGEGIYARYTLWWQLTNYFPHTRFCRSSIIPALRRLSRSTQCSLRLQEQYPQGLSCCASPPSRWWRHIGHTQPITGSHCVTVHKGDQEDPGPRVRGDAVIMMSQP